MLTKLLQRAEHVVVKESFLLTNSPPPPPYADPKLDYLCLSDRKDINR